MLSFIKSVLTSEPEKKPKHPLSHEDLQRQKISQENKSYVTKYPYLVNPYVETLNDQMHSYIERKVPRPNPRGTIVSVTKYSTIDTAIYYHKKSFSTICVLNFADAKKMGGGYLNGRNAQEESLCRQTLLYPTLKYSKMYQLYARDGDLYKEDYMTYSPNVKVIRDGNDRLISDVFDVNVISAPAVDNRKFVKDANKIMERRIRKIVKLAFYKGNQVLILGAFGCGVFNNDPDEVAKIFKKVLIKENLKDLFYEVSFPIYKNDDCKAVFQKVFHSKH